MNPEQLDAIHMAACFVKTHPLPLVRCTCPMPRVLGEFCANCKAHLRARARIGPDTVLELVEALRSETRR